MKINFGSGFKKKDGFVNVDKFEASQPDVVHDLSSTPWPFEDGSCDEALFEFSLEQIGTTPGDLLRVMRELYRVTANEAVTRIWFFHPRHDQFVMNPMCVHRLSVEFFQLLSVARNLSLIPTGVHDNLFALQLGVNFEVTLARPHISDEFRPDFEAGRLTEHDLIRKMRFENNVCHAVEVELRTVKETSTKTP